MIRLSTLLLSLFSFEHSSSFLSVPLFLKFIGRVIANAAAALWNLILKMAWSIIKFVLGIMEAFEYMINQFLGIDASVQDMVDYAENNQVGTSNFLSLMSKTFRAIMAVAIVLLIIFTIIAIVRQEYNNAVSGMTKGNEKKPMIVGMFKKMFFIALLPLTMAFIITGVNSILTAFSRAMKGAEDITLAAQVLSTSTYDSNKYRYYANQNKRVPIIIKTYDPSQFDQDENDQLVETIKSSMVQRSLAHTATNISTGNLFTFKESLTYKNNKLSNSTNYGDDYEKFVCTAEQYQVMADFVDYAQRNNLPFQIKSIDDPTVEWKLVNDVVFNPNDVSLKINYRDASDLNNNGKTNDSYTMEYSSSFNITSPISDAMESIMALLGIDEYSDNLYKTMERDEDYVNVVRWANEKVLIKLSSDFLTNDKISNPNTWTRVEQLIMYEYYHFASNNTFGKYSIQDLVDGVELDASQIVYKEYYPEANAYSKERVIDCVKINGVYYHIVKDPTQTDAYGNVYYVLKDAIAAGEEGSFLKNEFSKIVKQNNKYTRLMLSGDFELNDTETWSYSDQIIVYEYYKDLTANNMLFAYNFNDFDEDSGRFVDIPVYYITHGTLNGNVSNNRDKNGYYALINGTYYEVENIGGSPDYFRLISPDTQHGNNFLLDAQKYEGTYYYNYNIKLDEPYTDDIYGISTDPTSTKTAENFIYHRDVSNNIANFVPLEENDPNFENYSSFALQLSRKFDYNDVNTWTYLDYFIFYLYANHPKIAGNLGLESIRLSGLNGNIGKVDTTYVMQVKYGTYVEQPSGVTRNLYLYLKIDQIRQISQMLINQHLETDLVIMGNYVNTSEKNLFVTVSNINQLILSDTELYNFRFSEGFRTTTPADWTVLDYILYTLSDQGLISPIEDIKTDGYSALKYNIYEEKTETDKDGNDVTIHVLSDVMYKFGKGTSADKLYLSLNGVKQLKTNAGVDINFQTINEFLSMNLIDYIAKKYDITYRSLIVDQDGIIDNLYEDLKPYVYDSDVMINNIINQKGFDINDASNEFHVYENISNFRYENPDFEFDNLSTWTKLDALIYAVLGMVNSSYTSNVIHYDGKNYLIVGNYAVDISSNASPFKSTIIDNNTITSNTANYSSTDHGTLVEYYNSTYKDQYVFEASRFDDKQVKNYSTGTFRYSKLSAEITIFDVIYAGLKNLSAVNVGTTVDLPAYSDGNSVYLEIVGHNSVKYYVGVSTRFNDYISLETNSILDLNNKTSIATVVSSPNPYIAFNKPTGLRDPSNPDDVDYITDTNNLENFNNYYYNLLDAIIYYDNGVSYLDKSDSEKSYKFYNYNGKKYLFTGARYIEIKDGIEEYIDKDTLESLSEASEADILNELYNKRYSSLVKTSVSGMINEASPTQVTFSYSRPEGSDVTITRISPLALILSKIGVIDLESSNVGVDGYIRKTSNKTYFYYDGSTLGGDDLEVYIDITNIGYYGYRSLDPDNAYIYNNITAGYEMVLNYLLFKEAVNAGIPVDEFVASYATLETNIQTIASSKVEVSSLFTTLNNASGFAIGDASSWTDFNLLQYYLTENDTLSSQYILLVDAALNKYVGFSNLDGDVNYVKVNSGANLDNDLFERFSTSLVDYILQDSGSLEYTPLGIVGYKQTGQETGQLVKVVYGTATDFFYYTSNIYGRYSAIYELNNATIRTAVTAGDYTYYLDTTNVSDWSTFDYILAYTRGFSSSLEIKSPVYIYGSNAYIKIGTQYINLTKFGAFTTNQVNAIYATKDDTASKALTFSSPKIIETYHKNGDLGSHIFETALKTSSQTGMPGQLTDGVHFSEGFNISDYSTWTLSDFIIYYLFTINNNNQFNIPGNADSITNFQDLVNQEFIPARYYKYILEDDQGNSVLHDVIWFGITEYGTGIVVDKDLFTLYYGRSLANIEYENNGVIDRITLEIENTANAQNLSQINIEKNSILNSNDFIYNNYYYFTLRFSIFNQLKTSSAITSDIANGTASTKESINIKLSEKFHEENFDITTFSDWTWLDLIVIYEYSRDNIRHNYFEGLKFSDLLIDNYLPVFESGDEKIIEINGNFYDIAMLSEDKKTLTAMEGTTETEFSVSDIIDNGLEDKYDMRTLYESKEYFVKKTSDYSLDYSKTPETILYPYNDNFFYLTLNTNLIDNYKVNLAKLNTLNSMEISNIVREVNWPQKLMNDLQVIYPELNWSTLIATDGWLDTLGYFSSAQTSGEYVSEGNSANITAAGLVLSEFFLSVTTGADDAGGDYDYSYTPVFNPETIKSLMLSMLGENEYNDLSMQAEVFIEMFNNMFLPILQDIADERGIEMVEGKVDNFYMTVYKSFLSTVLLGSDMGEYFYKIATRVYAQYTIYESLASASGDYANYLDYINLLSGEDGEDITSFEYASFKELVFYENSFSGNTNPTFTFNFKSVMKYYLSGRVVNRSNIQGLGYSVTAGDSSTELSYGEVTEIFKISGNFERLVTKINETYGNVYGSGKKFSDNNESGIYCFLFEAYWTIASTLDQRNESYPTYLESYHDYLMGKIERWTVLKDDDIEASSGYIPNKKKYELQLKMQKALSQISVLSVYTPDPDLIDIEEEGSLWDKICDLVKDATTTSYSVLKAVFETNINTYSEYKEAFEDVFKVNFLSGNDLIEILTVMKNSEKGNIASWERILKLRDGLDLLSKELKEVNKIKGYGHVDDDPSRGYKSPAFEDVRYERALQDVLNLYNRIDSYVTSQLVLDKIEKMSITFTLAQFGKNYVTDGYNFEFENKKYTLKSSASPERLAEYVYGGAFLAKYGVPATYTNSEYNGFIESYKVYDSSSNSIKTKLNVWPELRSFVSEIANYTAKLYYLTNMNDLAENVGDGILMTDSLYEGTSTNSTGNKKTLEYMIIEYLLSSDISADTLLRLMFGDSTSTLTEMDSVEDEVIALAHYLEGTNFKLKANGELELSNSCPIVVIDGNEYVMTGSFKKDSLMKYMALVASDARYNSFGYYNEGTTSSAERVHIIFKKLISYLVVNEESEESTSEEAINLDGITFKQFKRILMKALSDYQKNPSETDLENSNRYITLFNLICSQFRYTYTNHIGMIEAGTSVSPVFLKDANGILSYIYSDGAGGSQICPLYSEFSIDVPTRDIILTMAGIENRPIEELVGLEYGNLYDRNGNYDELSGDTFVVCTYDEVEGKYYPVIARNPSAVVDNDTYKYIQKTGINVTTTFYENDYCYPVVAKGVIDASGYPTAIKMVDNQVIFYRTGITVTMKLGEDSIKRTRLGADVTTIGYTKYVNLNWSSFKSADNMAMFTGSSSVDSFLNSDMTGYFMQQDENYSISDVDNFDAISVLDQFSSFYTLGTQQIFLFLLGFSTILPLLFTASAAVLRRILDLIFLVLMGPIAISTMGLNPDTASGKGNGKIFDTWKSYLTQTLLHVFGFIIAFNIYYILTSTIIKMDLVTDSTMNMIYRVAGLSSFVTKSSINSLLRFVYIVAAGGAIRTSADLLVNIVTCGKATNAFQTQMSQKGVLSDIKDMATQLKESMEKLKGVTSGKVLMQAKDFALESAKNMIPGAQLVTGAVHMGQNIATKKKAKSMEEAAISNGLSPAVAKKMSQSFAQNEMKQRDAKRQQSAKNANQFLNNVGIGGKLFEAPKPTNKPDKNKKKKKGGDKKSGKKSDKKKKNN